MTLTCPQEAAAQGRMSVQASCRALPTQGGPTLQGRSLVHLHFCGHSHHHTNSVLLTAGAKETHSELLGSWLTSLLGGQHLLKRGAVCSPHQSYSASTQRQPKCLSRWYSVVSGALHKTLRAASREKSQIILPE